MRLEMRVLRRDANNIIIGDTVPAAFPAAHLRFFVFVSSPSGHCGGGGGGGGGGGYRVTEKREPPGAAIDRVKCFPTISLEKKQQFN